MTEIASATSTVSGPAAQPAPSAAPPPASPPSSRAARWPLVLLALALVWVVLVRVPLVLNSRSHIDSDLAVDGLTLREAVGGHWRWHYPGTPYSGIIPVLYSLPQAAIWGANPETLVSGGTVAFAALVVATFVLTWTAFGRDAAAWSLVPLTFASTGSIWLSGRITGGHLSAAVWHAAAFLLLYASMTRASRWYPFVLGVWSGLGMYVDSMYVLTLVGLVAAAVGYWWLSGRSLSASVAVAVFTLGFAAGIVPREVGARVEPHNAYPSQFVLSLQSGPLLNHVRLLGMECLPRLIAGHRLPDLQADPDPAGLGGPAPTRGPRDTSPIAMASTVILLVLFVASIRALTDRQSSPADSAATAVRWGLILSALATIGAFVVNLNIYNSDNYRYLVTLLVPWSVGFGLSLRSMARLGRGGLAAAALCAVIVAGLMTVDTARWYRRFLWITESGRPIVTAIDDPALTWLNQHPEFDRFLGNYWDVYRLSFLATRPVRGIPFRVFPDRFPEWSLDLNGGRPEIVLNRHFQGSRGFVQQALQDGGETLERGPGFSIVTWPRRKDER